MPSAALPPAASTHLPKHPSHLTETGHGKETGYLPPLRTHPRRADSSLWAPGSLNKPFWSTAFKGSQLPPTNSQTKSGCCLCGSTALWVLRKRSHLFYCYSRTFLTSHKFFFFYSHPRAYFHCLYREREGRGREREKPKDMRETH